MKFIRLLLITTLIYETMFCFDEKSWFYKEMEIISSLMGYCPYCDPNYMDIPNLQSAMKGYDLPMGDPNSKALLLKSNQTPIYI